MGEVGLMGLTGSVMEEHLELVGYIFTFCFSVLVNGSLSRFFTALRV